MTLRIADDFQAIAEARKRLMEPHASSSLNCMACHGAGWTFHWWYSPLGKPEKIWTACGGCANPQGLAKPEE